MPPRTQAPSRQRTPGTGDPGPGRPPRSTAPSTIRRLILAALVLAAGFLPYAASTGYQFVWDDAFVIGPHLDVRGPSDLARLWRTPYDAPLREAGRASVYFRPAVLYSLALDRALFGSDPGGYHLTNAVAYALACLFLWLFAWELSGRPTAAAAGAVLFALHPTHPESVAFVSGRTDALAGLFLFAALWSSARWGPRIRAPLLRLAPAAGLFLLAMLAKEVALFAAPVLPIVLWARARTLRPTAVLTSALPVAAAAAIYLLTRSAVLGRDVLPDVVFVAGAIPQLLTSVALVARYVPLLLVPVGLSARHEFAPREHPDLLFAAGLITLVAIALLLVTLLRRRSPWAVPLALFATTLLPLCVVRLLYGTIMAERFLFVPSGAIAPAVALLPGLKLGRARNRARVPGRERRAGAGDAAPGFLFGCGLAAAVFLWALLPRISIWKDDGTLYASMVRDAPRSAYAHAVLAGHLRDRGDYARAAQLYREAFALEPAFPEPLLDLADAEVKLGEADSSFAHLRLLTRLRPDHAEAWYTLGNLFVGIDRPDSARRAYETALRLRPRFAEAENNLGAVFDRMGLVDEALVHFRRAVAIAPGNREAARNLARLEASARVPENPGGRRSP